MNRNAEKWVLVFVCTLVNLNTGSQALGAVLPLLVTVTFSALHERFASRAYSPVLPCLGLLSGIFYPPLYYYLPVFIYDAWPPAHPLIPLLALPALALNLQGGSELLMMTPILMVLAVLMKRRAVDLREQVAENHRLRDTAAEYTDALSSTNRRLIQEQDERAKLAILEERARIARDLHDSVGHVLSSALLQTGALDALCEEEVPKQRLKLLSRTLSEGMDEVRAALHSLRDEAFSLETQARKLTDEFTLCPVTLEYSLSGDEPADLKLAFAAILKEALSNATRHSNATRVSVILREHPAFYQLIVRDNGTGQPGGDGGGMGLDNMRVRAEAVGGTALVGQSAQGFEVFVSVKKEVHA